MKQLPQSISRGAIYARVSSQKQKEGETIESQVTALRALALQKGCDVPEAFVFLDNGVSGSILQRPALDELRDVIRTEPLDVLFIYAPDRLSRNYTYQLILLEEFRRHGVGVHFLKSPPETDTPEAKMLSHFQGIFAEYERALILDRSRRGRMYKAKQNDPSILPCMPFGYRRVNTGREASVHIIEEQAAIVREIFRLYVHERLPLQGVAAKLMNEGIKTPKGHSKWNIATVRGILKNQAYIGTTHYGKTERCEGIPDRIRYYPSGRFQKPMHARRTKPEAEWLPIDMPPLISESDFELAQEQLNKNAIHASRNTKEPGLLQGLVLCGECGEPFYKRARQYIKKRVGLYHCRSRREKKVKKCSNKAVRQEILDQLVYSEVLKLLKNPSLVQAELARRTKEVLNVEDEARREVQIKKALSKLSQDRDRILDAYQEGLLSLEELVKRNRSIDTRRGDLEKSMQAIRALKLEHVGKYGIEASFNSLLKRMEEAAESLTFSEKQKLVRLLVEKVVVKADKITVVHCISPRILAKENSQLILDGPG